jgi:MFS family permease
LAQNITQLVIARVVQGIGAAGVQLISPTIVALATSPRRRPTSPVTAVLATMWASDGSAGHAVPAGAAVAIAVPSFGAFVVRERRAAEPSSTTVRWVAVGAISRCPASAGLVDDGP